MLNIATLVVFHEQICDHTLDLFGGLEVIVLLKVESENVLLIQTELAINKFHCVFILAVGVLTLTLGFESAQQ